MKRITIFQEGLSPIAIDDNDEKQIEQYTRELSQLLENNSVSILHTTSSSIIIRPNKITSIVVSEMTDIQPPKPTPKKKQKQKPVKKEETQDIITD